MLLYSLANELLNVKIYNKKKERTQSYWLYIYSGSFTRNKYNTKKIYEIKIVIKYLQKALGEKKEWKILKNKNVSSAIYIEVNDLLTWVISIYL